MRRVTSLILIPAAVFGAAAASEGRRIEKQAGHPQHLFYGSPHLLFLGCPSPVINLVHIRSNSTFVFLQGGPSAHRLGYVDISSVSGSTQYETELLQLNLVRKQMGHRVFKCDN